MLYLNYFSPEMQGLNGAESRSYTCAYIYNYRMKLPCSGASVARQILSPSP